MEKSTAALRFKSGLTFARLGLNYRCDISLLLLKLVPSGKLRGQELTRRQKPQHLSCEFEASMQAIMAAAIALDAFYAMIQPHVVLPPTLVERWRTGRTARFSQVTEVIRRAFRLKPKGTESLRANLKEIYRVRDLAVHPSGKIEAPIYHTELDVEVEWRFAYFRASNAELIVNGATWILWDLCHSGKPADAKVLEYIGNLKQRLVALFPNGHPSAATAVSPP